MPGARFGIYVGPRTPSMVTVMGRVGGDSLNGYRDLREPSTQRLRTGCIYQRNLAPCAIVGAGDQSYSAFYIW